jgi:hypothetical protein
MNQHTNGTIHQLLAHYYRLIVAPATGDDGRAGTMVARAISATPET